MGTPPVTLLTVNTLSAGYGKAEVLHGVSLSVAPGQIVAIVGPNGAGKTTLMHAVMGLLPRQGQVALWIRPLATPAGWSAKVSCWSPNHAPCSPT